MRNVIAVSDKREADFFQIAEALLQSEVIGQRLTRVLKIAESIDHRDGSVLAMPAIVS